MEKQIITEKDYDRWKKLALIVAEDEYYADEILHIVIEEILKKWDTYPDFVIPDSYIFVALRNRLVNLLKKETGDKALKEKVSHQYYFGESKYDSSIDDDIKDKHKAIEKVVDSLDFFDKQLYHLHFSEKLSQRKISRETGITLPVIHDRVNKIKNKIRTEYEKKEAN